MNCNDFPLLNERLALTADSYLQPYSEKLTERHCKILDKIRELADGSLEKLKDFAAAHEYYGLHKKNSKWIFRE